MRVTRAAMTVKMVIVKVKQTMTPMVGTGKGKGLVLSMAQESKSIPDEVHLLGMARCLSLLEDSIPLEIKEEAQGRPINKGL